MIVPLPPPEGELTTNSVPLLDALLSGFGSCSSVTLLDILNLLAKFFDLRFYRQSRLLNREIGGLGKCSVCFAIEFLQKKVEHLPGLTRSVKRLLKLREMAEQTDHLLAYVTSIRKISNFLGQPHRIDFDNLTAAVEQLSDTLLQAQAIGIGETGG